MTSNEPARDTQPSGDESGTPSTPTGQWAIFGGNWCSYTDSQGNRVQLAIAVHDGRVILTTASGEVLIFTGVELGMLLENLNSVTG